MRFLSKTNNKQGFTILEMVVVAGIFVVVTGIILANLPQFRNRASLDLTAQEVALSIREAQVYGTATRIAGNDYPSYGIHFELSGNDSNKNFFLFADSDQEKDYDPGEGCNTTNTECLEKYLIDGRFIIKDICVDNRSKCFKDDIATDIVFTRPFPEPVICTSQDSICDPVKPQHFNLVIVIGAPNTTEEREVKVWTNGQITATNNSQ